MKNILVTGSSGQLGQEIKKSVINRVLENETYNWIFADRKVLDICNEQDIINFICENNIDTCINCAAYTGVDKAEEDRNNCKLINTIAVEYLAKACKAKKILLVHISSDYVFDGTKTEPYLESDNTNPINYYGETKLEGENLALKNNPKTIIIRTSWLFRKEFL
jgi:dTDP-4-dehydrorhamnose reductase